MEEVVTTRVCIPPGHVPRSTTATRDSDAQGRGQQRSRAPRAAACARRATDARSLLPRKLRSCCVVASCRIHVRASDLRFLAFHFRGTPAALLALRSTCCALATCLMEELVVRFGASAGTSGRQETSIRLLLPASATVTDLKCHLNATGWPVGPDQTVRTPKRTTSQPFFFLAVALTHAPAQLTFNGEVADGERALCSFSSSEGLREFALGSGVATAGLSAAGSSFGGEGGDHLVPCTPPPARDCEPVRPCARARVVRPPPSRPSGGHTPSLIPLILPLTRLRSSRRCTATSLRWKAPCTRPPTTPP